MNESPATPPGTPQGGTEVARVIIVHQSQLTAMALERILSSVPGLSVVGSARHGGHALPLIERLRPDVICCEIEMPVMDGLMLTRTVMTRHPVPILVLESPDRAGEAAAVAAMLEAGALDSFRLPRDLGSLEGARNDFAAKVRRLSRVPVISRSSRPRYPEGKAGAASGDRAPGGAAAGPGTVPSARAAGNDTPASNAASRVAGASEIVAIGSSTGGPQVLLSILSVLPASYPRAVLCVQHISKGFLSGMVDWLNSQCALTVKIAHTGETPRAGHVYFAAEDHHLELDARGKIWLTQSAPVSGHRPAVTTLFESVARRKGSRATGILLTGMGTDGALGLAAMARSGALTIAQSEATCVVFGMPRQAIALGAAKLVLSPAEIARKLVEL